MNWNGVKEITRNEIEIEWEVKGGLFGNTNNLYQNFSQALNLLPLFGFNLFVCVWKQRWILMGFNLFSSSSFDVYSIWSLENIYSSFSLFLRNWFLHLVCLNQASSARVLCKMHFTSFSFVLFHLLRSQWRWIIRNTNVAYLIPSHLSS